MRKKWEGKKKQQQAEGKDNKRRKGSVSTEGETAEKVMAAEKK